MGVHVVAVGRVDVVADPDAGVGDAQAGGAEPAVERRGRAGGGVAALGQAERGAGEREVVEQRLGEVVVVVAGDDHDLAVAEGGAELLEEGAGGVQRGADRDLAQLDRVAEQDDAVGAADLLQQQRADAGVAQQVAAAEQAEVEVGEDRRPHRAPFTGLAHLAGGQTSVDWMHSFGEERMAPANGIELAYQEMGDPDGEAVILIMGLATQMIAWDEEFCALLADRGYRVVRFDNRDIGRSTLIKEAGVPSRIDMLTGRRATAAYLLSDMARDTVGLMDHLGVEAAHLVGASMGGMIAQQVAIEFPERTRSLVSIMSTTGSRWTGLPSFKAFGVLLGTPPMSREAVIERAVKTFRVIGSPGFPFEEERVRDYAGRSYDRGHCSAGVARQLHAIMASGDRTQGAAPPRPAGDRDPRRAATTWCGPPAAAPPPRRSPAPACG